MTRFAPFLLPLALIGCTGTLSSTEQTAVVQSVTALATVAAAHNTTASQWLKEGALICGQINTINGQLVIGSAVIVANAAGVPVSVTGQIASAVALACPAGTSPGALPATANTSVLPVIQTNTTLPPVT